MLEHLLLIAEDEPPPFRLENADGGGPLVVLCDHASNAVPRALGGLGLTQEDRDSHFGWDIGAAQVAAIVAGKLDAPALYCGYSRLVIDCNRPVDAFDSIVPEIDGRPVPGNREVDATARMSRIDTFFRPYHRAVSELLDRRAGRGLPSRLASIHSFTPVYRGSARPWHIGVSYGSHSGLARALLAVLRSDPALVVGEQEPYPIEAGSDFAIPVHGDARGNDAALIEIRQDLVATQAQATAWGERLADALSRALGEA